MSDSKTQSSPDIDLMDLRGRPVYKQPCTPPRTTDRDAKRDVLYKRVAWRIMPLLLLAQALAYLDRINIGTAKLQMAANLHFSDTVYGLGAGIFFIGYFTFEIPSNLFLHRFGARKWIAWIMVAWGCLSTAMLLVQSVPSFYVVRFLLGVAEAGFFPGMVLYLTFWFPAQRRGRMMALLMTATALGGLIGGPLSGWILTRADGYLGMTGWRWLFFLEGFPAVIVGLWTYSSLPSTPHDATWLSDGERALIASDLADSRTGGTQHGQLRHVVRGVTWLYASIYFLLLAALYGISFWLPSLIKTAGIADTSRIGWLIAVPYSVAALVMNLVARSADRRRNWSTVVGVCALLAGAGFLASAFYAEQVVPAMIALTLAASGILSALPLFWSLPTERLKGAAAVTGIAIINSVGNLAGFVSPFAMGWLTDLTHHTVVGVGLLGVAAALAGLLTLAYAKPQRDKTGEKTR